MNNFLFGKTCENLRNRVSVTLLSKAMRRKFTKITAQATYKQCQIITKDLCTVERAKTNILLNKPIYIGTSADLIIRRKICFNINSNLSPIDAYI